MARGLGFTTVATSGNEVVNWTRVRQYLADLGVVQKCTTGDHIPESIFYRLVPIDYLQGGGVFTDPLGDTTFYRIPVQVISRQWVDQPPRCPISRRRGVPNFGEM